MKKYLQICAISDAAIFQQLLATSLENANCIAAGALQVQEMQKNGLLDYLIAQRQLVLLQKLSDPILLEILCLLTFASNRVERHKQSQDEEQCCKMVAGDETQLQCGQELEPACHH